MTQGQGTHAVDVLFYATDHLGSTILAVDANQTIQTRNLYMPFGDPGAVQEGTALRHRYIGGVILEESGLYALGPRLYDPEVGRFLSPDPLVASPTNPQAFNRYSYALNNPVTLSDPSGLAPIYPGMEDPGGNSSSVDYYGPITHSTGSTRGPNYGNLARGCYADGRCPSQPQTPAISNPGSPTTQPYAANDVEGSQGGAQGFGQVPDSFKPFVEGAEQMGGALRDSPIRQGAFDGTRNLLPQSVFSKLRDRLFGGVTFDRPSPAAEARFLFGDKDRNVVAMGIGVAADRTGGANPNIAPRSLFNDSAALSVQRGRATPFVWVGPHGNIVLLGQPTAAVDTRFCVTLSGAGGC